MQPEGMTPSDLDAVTEAVLDASVAFVAIAMQSVSDLLTDITLTQFRVLVVLAMRGPLTLVALSEALDVSPSTGSRLCERLARKKLVRRQQSRKDRREVRLSLTDLGRTVYVEVLDRRRARIADIAQALPLETRANLVLGLRAFTVAAGAAPDQPWSLGWSASGSADRPAGPAPAPAKARQPRS